jgi:dihydrofolate reductase
MGLRGRLPWHDKADLRWFREMTWGHEIIVGAATLRTLPHLPGRAIIPAERFATPQELRDYVRHTATQHVYLIGGPKTFARFASVVDRWYVNKINYDGPADAWFDSAWLLADEG